MKAGIIAAVIITAVAAVASVALLRPQRASAPVTVATPKADSGVTKLHWAEQPQPAASTPFLDRDGNTKTLADFAGRIVLVNFWATWCAPCVKEMPTLDALQQALGGDQLAVVAISQDREGARVAAPFMAENHWDHLALYTEPAARFAKDAAIRGLPTSIIVNRQGQEVARLEGTAEWNSPEMHAALKKLIETP